VIEIVVVTSEIVKQEGGESYPNVRVAKYAVEEEKIGERVARVAQRLEIESTARESDVVVIVARKRQVGLVGFKPVTDVYEFGMETKRVETLVNLLAEECVEGGWMRFNHDGA